MGGAASRSLRWKNKKIFGFGGGWRVEIFCLGGSADQFNLAPGRPLSRRKAEQAAAKSSVIGDPSHGHPRPLQPFYDKKILKFFQRSCQKLRSGWSRFPFGAMRDRVVAARLPIIEEQARWAGKPPYCAAVDKASVPLIYEAATSRLQ